MKNHFKNELELLKEEEDKQMYTPEQIKYRLAGYYELPYNAEIQFILSLAKLPHKIIDFAVKYLFFMTSDPETSGARTFLITNKYKAIVHFHPKFWERLGNDVEDGIAHEIAHAYLKHRFDTDNENKDVEKDADELASKWLYRKVTIGKTIHNRSSK